MSLESTLSLESRTSVCIVVFNTNLQILDLTRTSAVYVQWKSPSIKLLPFQLRFQLCMFIESLITSNSTLWLHFKNWLEFLGMRAIQLVSLYTFHDKTPKRFAFNAYIKAEHAVLNNWSDYCSIYRKVALISFALASQQTMGNAQTSRSPENENPEKQLLFASKLKERKVVHETHF
jgi:hypothetical protein